MKSAISHDSETPAHGQQIITACAFIHHTFDGVEKVFMARRAETKKFMPGVLELPGGHIDFDEDPVEGLKREVMEENKMRVKIGDPFCVFTYTNHVKGSHSIEVIYFATFEDSLENIQIDPEHQSEFVWLSENEIDKVISVGKPADDDEILALRKGFALLKGSSLDF